MSNGAKTRTRSQRVASVELPRGRFAALAANLRKGRVLLRIALCMLTALAILAMTRGWDPPRDFRPDRIPERAVTVRTPFDEVDPEATDEARDEARRLAVAVYDHNPASITLLKSELKNDLSTLISADNFEAVNQDLWESFSPPLAEGTPEPTLEEQQQQFQRFKQSLSQEGAMDTLKGAIDELFLPLEQHGVIAQLPAEHDANPERIEVRPLGSTGSFDATFPVSEVRLEDVLNRLQRQITQKVPSLEVANRVFARISDRLPAATSLKLNREATSTAQREAVDKVELVQRHFQRGDLIAPAGQPLTEEQLTRLELEYQQEIADRSAGQRLGLALAVLGMYVALFTVGGFFVYRLDGGFVSELPRLVTLLLTILATVGVMLLTHANGWRAEAIPLLLFGMTIAVVSRQDVALLLSAAMTLVIVMAVGYDLVDAIVLQAAATGAILTLDSVRTRSKLLVVGFLAAAVGLLTAIGAGVVAGHEIAPTVRIALNLALWCVIAGSLMTCLLPLVEKVYGVQTDLSLIELGDPAHPLLQELIRRAPGTYNHSITVASLAQAAAESIGGRGLLVRVGAYFHDIGKMLKPGYFIENQSRGDNRHDTLVPAMSTLVIIAHVKDGADLARQNNLPECIVDFIQQHHGTTLVEYFYRQAANKKNEDPDAADVDERSFRYPGPKPQTKEAGVLMLADAVESASRVLVEPTPARIESLVEDITRKRLDDGQFDECGLTLQELRKIGDSLVKSLTAVYHGRVKYPDQETA
ncbi:hypothetical protein KOR34_17820 [Posidoniimonas corsicana]|uniref:HD/PDEase domain-containing protein n=1 Tax=Posidoniimonas corsicana TaxID=1938618 RepID=A0A5C5VFV5_9BACT|nr:HDIG domain-containing metalloprotein [Posidoniimonas corsicana]TWT36837.1 hypothetical protein KOR34_17820 [Posidoniimonas corsicana]